MKRIKEKIVISFVVLMMMITLIPSSQLINAEGNTTFSVSVTEIDTNTQSIDVTVTDESITKIDLSLDGVIESREASENLSFDVHINGDYTITGYNIDDEEVYTESVSISSFDDLIIEKDDNHVVSIVSRYPLTEEVLVNGTDSVSMDNTGLGYYEGNYTIPQNGEYNFVVIANGVEEDSATMTFTDLPEVEEPGVEEPGTGEPEVPGEGEPGTDLPGEPGVDVPEVPLPEVPEESLPEVVGPITNEAGEIVISSEADFTYLINDPTANFILANDIELTNDVLSEVIFSGTLNGNGYMISGFSGSLFNAIDNATINNVVLKGMLANTSSYSTINDSGFYIEESDDTLDVAVILNSDSTTINNSFVLMNVDGYRVAGFILDGTGTINNSYVSGYLKGEEVTGFGQDVEVNNSYINASLVGDERTLFTNQTDGVSDDSFYDVQINDLEDEYATPMYTKDLIAGDFFNDEFTIIEGQYPQIKNIQLMKEKAQQVSTLSVLSVKTESNLSALEGIVETEEKEEIEWVQTEEEISANSNIFMNRFALRQAVLSTGVSAGIQTTAKTTQVSFPIKNGNYYKVVVTSETPSVPNNHEDAIADGWKIMYWSGTHRQTGLNWNTSYTVYSTDLSGLDAVGTISTVLGDNGGKLTLTGTYEAGQEMTATLSGTNTTKGTLYWETVSTLTIGAVAVKNVKTTQMNGSVSLDSYTVQANDIGNNYLRVRFVADETTGYKGTLTDATINIIKEDITSVSIENKTSQLGKFTLGDQLVANMLPIGYENEVTFMWFHTGDNGNMENIDYNNPIAVGRNYQIKGSDIGKQLFVRAVVKEEGRFKESKNSTPTIEIEGILAETPFASNLQKVRADDITVTLKMEVEEGLYRYGYSEVNSSLNLKNHPVLSRNKTETTITGLKPNTTYYFYVQRVGENGYGDSGWSSDFLSVTTEKEHVKGDVEISGEYVFGKVLTAKIINNPMSQTGEFKWYRLNANGDRVEESITTGNTYTLVQADIGAKLEVAYVGTVNYAGEITTISDTINKAEKTAPITNLSVSAGGIEDTKITVTMPTSNVGEKYIVGVSNSESGVPIEQLENGQVKVLDFGASYTITGLDRDTEYHLYVRYAESDTHYKSDWIDSVNKVRQTTAKKDFEGNISFVYETTNKLMQGQTLTANLDTADSSFNYKGEWKWERIDASNISTPITNFTLTVNKQGTQYIVPTTAEEIGVKYKVTFTANVGFEGTVEAESTEVQTKTLEHYKLPAPDDIIMEAIDDSSFKVKMDQGEGKYLFEYKKKNATVFASIRGFFNKMLSLPEDGFTAIGTPVIANVNVVVSGLPRNTEYIVRVKRVTDDGGLESNYAYSTSKTNQNEQSVFTMKTEIAGNVTIEGNTRYDQTLTATYHEASYASTGTTTEADKDGKWQWYRGNTLIENSTSAIYIIGEGDIGKVLTVKYTMPESHSFTGEVKTNTTTIQKATGIAPKIGTIEDGNSTSGSPAIIVTGNLGTGTISNVYYRLQIKGEPAPSKFPTDEEIRTEWKPVTNAVMTIDADWRGNKLVSRESYTIYFIKTETTTEEASPILSASHTIGTFQQGGTISFEKLADGKDAFVVGQTVKANLVEGNNSEGAWRWYKSITAYDGTITTSAPDSNAAAAWKEITSGFSQMNDNKTSALNISEEMFGHYIRAEFTPKDTGGYSGSVSSQDNQFVKKIYNEKITITSSTMDGNGVPKAYANTELTGTLENIVDGNSSKRTVQFKIGDTVITPTTISDNTFTYTMTNVVAYDNLEITAEVSKPTVIELYVDTNLVALTSDNLSSKTSTGTSMVYTSGVPISSENDLEQFMLAQSPYDDRSSTSKYVLTKHINMSEKGIIVYSETSFSGLLDGDYHTIVELKNPLFAKVTNAIIKNLIFYSASVSTKHLTANTEKASASIITRQTIGGTYQRIMLADSIIDANHDTGYLIGKIMSGTVIVDECYSAGGKIIPVTPQRGAAGGLIGYAEGVSILQVTNSFSTNTILEGTQTGPARGGFLGGSGGNTSILIKDSYVASKLDFTSSGAGGISPAGPTIVNGFFDSTLAPARHLADGNKKGTPLPTSQMIGNELKTYFGEENYVYKEGYYPALKWSANHPITKLYTATRGAFTSADGKTLPTDMFAGNIFSPIQIPAELQSTGYSVSTSDEMILKVTSGGTIIPVGNQGDKAIITITYTEPDETIGGSASNTFEFTVRKQVTAMESVAIVNEDGTALENAPTMNQKLNAISNPEGSTYQWYRRRSGTAESILIPTATNQIYEVTAEDVGCELRVLVGTNDAPPIFSEFTKTAIFIKPDMPIVQNQTDSTVDVISNGDNAFRYEYGYIRADANATITQVEGTHAYDEVITINNLQRNRPYKFVVRIAADTIGSYPASEWSEFTEVISTTKTTITGVPQLGPAITKGSALTLKMETTNGQTGKWTLERWNAEETSNTDITFNEVGNDAVYTLTSEDVGHRIKAIFTGTDDFEGTTSEMSGVIQKEPSTQPSKPTFVTKNDTTIVVKMESVGTYDIAYAISQNGDKTIKEKATGKTDITFSNLVRNKDYFFFARVSETETHAASPWSDLLKVTTNRTNIMSNQILFSGSAQVDQDIGFTAPSIDKLTGSWKLERVKKVSELVTSTTTISSSNYTVSNNALTYKVQPKDAGAKLVVTYTGNGDFEGVISHSTDVVINAQQGTAIGMPTGVTITDVKDYSFKIQANDGNETYQFGYITNSSEKITVEATVGAKTDVLIDGLHRNTEYRLYIRKAAKLGYDESDWIDLNTTQKTNKTSLTGTVEYVILNGEQEESPKVGVAVLGTTYKAKYIPGKDEQVENGQLGYWQWFADDKPIDGATSETYTIQPMVAKEISASFIAYETGDFTSSRSANIGTLTKPKYNLPTLPSVTEVAEDKSIGSKLKITSNDINNVFYFVQNAKNPKVPVAILASDAEKNVAALNQWFKANEEIILNLDANTEYVVYVARLEDETNLSSGVVSLRTVKTVKEDISQIDSITITEADNRKWKVLQNKELRISSNNLPVEGVWQYYVSQTPTENTSWQNVTSEIKSRTTEGKEATYAFTKVNVPSKYNGYYVRVVFIGRGDFENSEIYTSDAVLIGTEIKGQVEISTGDASEVFVPINVKYVYKDVDGTDITDEKNGIWTWYRKEPLTAISEVIKNGGIGTTDEYTPTAEDVGKHIYAVYTASTGGDYSGSVISGEIKNVKRAAQNKPDIITLKQVNGTSIEVNLPSNMKTDGKTIAQPRLEYRIQNNTSANEWTVNTAGDAWITGLKANTTYDIQAVFAGTSEYEPSVPSDLIEVTTGNQLFDIDNLVIDEPQPLVSGAKITATYAGPGYNEGNFVLKRSNGDIIPNITEPIIKNGFLFFTNSSASITYTLTEDDIGNNIIIQFVGKTGASTYGGSIEKSTDEVVKAKSTAPTKPELVQVEYSETELKVQVDTANEYVLKDSANAFVKESEWKKLNPVTEEFYVFTELLKEKDYYLHTRVAETSSKGASEEIVSEPLKPWARTTYEITYENVEDSEHSNPKEYTELTPKITLKDAARTGYTFKGWTTAEVTTPQKGLTIELHSSGHKTFKANWIINQYTVTFDTNGGSNVGDTVDVNHGGQVLKPTDPTKEGHTFAGWFSNSQLTTEFNFDSAITETITIYAKWTINKYDVTFDTNGGSSVEIQKIEHDGTVTQPTDNPTKKGYTFAGWYSDSKLTTKFNFTSTITSATTIYAKWDLEKYTITYELGDVSITTTNPTEFTIETEAFTLANPTRVGYTFKGWIGTGIDTPQSTVIITKGSTGNRTYTAQWEVIKYTVTFNTNGGSDVGKVEINHGEKVTEPVTDPTKTGYTFAGWYRDIDLQHEFDFTSTITSETTIYAKWELEKYTIDYVLGDGSSTPSNPVEFTIETEGFTLENPTRTGYTFKGWTWTEQTTPQTTVTISKGSTGNRTYTANWEATKHTVTFNTDSGSAVSSVEVDHGGKVSKPSAEPTKDKYKFIGWFKENSFDTEWDFANDTVTADTTIYAKFIEILDVVKTDKDPSNKLNKGDTVTLTAKDGATIYYTIDGADPTSASTVYGGPITINDAVTIKAIAVLDGYATSEVATFTYEVFGKIEIENPENDFGQVTNTNDEIIKAVLSDDEYQKYLDGTDAKVRIDFKEITGDLSSLITNALNGRKIAERIDITIFKTVGVDSEIPVTELTGALNIVIKIPEALLTPPEGTKRTFDVIRIHGNAADYLTDTDAVKETVTVESDKFSEYILCYKDETTNPPVDPNPPVTPDRPGKPDEPEIPEVPVDPEEPINPDKPIDPDEPVNPNKPVIPDTPGTPEEPTLPDTPVIGGDTEKPAPSVPSTGGETEQEGTVVKPGPDGETPSVKPDGTIDVPEGGEITVGGNDVALPDGGTVNKDGSISIKAGSTVIINGEEVYFDKDGTINPDGSYEVSKNSYNNLILPIWMLMYIGGFIALFRRRKEGK